MEFLKYDDAPNNVAQAAIEARGEISRRPKPQPVLSPLKESAISEITAVLQQKFERTKPHR